MAFECICQAGSEMVIFNSSFFEDSVYDLVICSRMRSTFHLDQYIKVVRNEMAL